MKVAEADKEVSEAIWRPDKKGGWKVFYDFTMIENKKSTLQINLSPSDYKHSLLLLPHQLIFVKNKKNSIPTRWMSHNKQQKILKLFIVNV